MAKLKPEWQFDTDFSPKWKVINSEVKKIVSILVHTYDIADTYHDNKDTFNEWLVSEKGKWVMEHAVEPVTANQHHDFSLMVDRYYIIAKLYEQDATYFTLKWK